MQLILTVVVFLPYLYTKFTHEDSYYALWNGDWITSAEASEIYFWLAILATVVIWTHFLAESDQRKINK